MVSKTMRLGLATALCAALSVAATTAHAQNVTGDIDPSLDIQNFQPVASPFGIFTTDSSKVLGEFQFSGAFLLNFAKEPLVLVNEDTGESVPLVDQQLAGDVMAAIGFFDVAELAVALPVYFINDGQVNAASIEGATIGDLRLRPKLNVLDSENGPIGLGFYLQVGLPTGNNESFTSSGSFYARPGVIVDTRINRLMLSANFGTNLQEERKFANLDVGSQLFYNAGAEYQIVEETWLVGAELLGSTSFNDFLSSKEETPLEGILGVKYRTQVGVNFVAGAGGGLVSGFGAPAYRLFTGVRYAEYSTDWDEDGILNADDSCPRDPEDRDGWEDEDGCPDPNNDNDLYVDIEDNCPNDPEDEDGWEDEDGCSDPDNDKDTVADVDDDCPNEPGLPEYQGCPDPDIDKDGIVNAEDKCVDVPGVLEYQGCPVPDRDKDGIIDTKDACPDDPEDKDGFEDKEGCPDGDNDKDKVCDQWVDQYIASKGMNDADAKAYRGKWGCTGSDACPMRPGKLKWNGCPGKQKAVIEKGEIKILERVLFKTGSSVIQRQSYGLLDEVAAIIIGTPGLKKIEIQGHTDDVGGDASNKKLSIDRAASVRTYLINAGANAGTLTSNGYGEEQPAIPIAGLRGRELRDARSANRRVQFKILEQDNKVKVIEVGPGQ